MWQRILLQYLGSLRYELGHSKRIQSSDAGAGMNVTALSSSDDDSQQGLGTLFFHLSLQLLGTNIGLQWLRQWYFQRACFLSLLREDLLWDTHSSIEWPWWYVIWVLAQLISFSLLPVRDLHFSQRMKNECSALGKGCVLMVKKSNILWMELLGVSTRDALLCSSLTTVQ